jgi:bis(5'-nucleosyl)-tetraphosphatase (symmetrical)
VLSDRERVFIGDVQGCADELDELLALAAGKLGGDFDVWSVGDLVNRGPDNLRVLERMHALHAAGRARIVLGNHEIGLLMRWLGVREAGDADTLEDILQAPDAEAWIAWLRSLPLVETGELAGQPFAMVHASVHPDWDLAGLVAHARGAEKLLRELEPAELRRWLGGERLASAGAAGSASRDVLDRLTRCRSVGAATDAWSDALPAKPEAAWHHRWSEKRHAYGLVYGHWALQGLHVATGLRGLDTACVHHGRNDGRGGVTEGRLTAWTPQADASRGDRPAFDVPDDRFLQVRARRRYRTDDRAR